jgi:hypothetical protein
MATFNAPANRSWVTAGSSVFDAAGKELGKIDALRESYFKLDVSMGFDYWLPYHLIERADGDRLLLSVTEAELDEHKVDAEAEEMTATEMEEATDGTDHPVPMERRYAAEADYLLHPH